MLNLRVKLSSVDEIRDFVNKCCSLNCEIDLAAGRYIVDAKSILGVCSVDLTRDLELSVYTDNTDEVVEVLQPYMV
ncbi:MAG: HPr family phosphocarrier protein [bacterium]|nr:HPr family phosphocarrier protein [bacterium]